jgi:hypothetical protein
MVPNSYGTRKSAREPERYTSADEPRRTFTMSSFTIRGDIKHSFGLQF